LPTKTLPLQSSFASSNFFFLLFLSLSSLVCGPSSFFSFRIQERRKKKILPSPSRAYPRKSDRLPKFPFDLFRLERVERNLHRGIHRDPTGLTRGKRLKDPGEDARGRCKGKEERGSEIREKLSPFFLFLSFGRRLVLKRWSQKFSFNFCALGEKSPTTERYKTHNKHTRTKAQNAESAKEDGGLRTPPSSRAFPSSSSSSSSRFLLFCSPFSACAGESFRKQTEREGEKGRPVRFSARIFLLLSLSLSSLFCAALSPFCSLSFSLSLCFRAAASVFSRLVTKQQQLSLLPLFFPHSQNKKSKSASRARV